LGVAVADKNDPWRKGYIDALEECGAAIRALDLDGILGGDE
jgi:hypothetical protein